MDRNYKITRTKSFTDGYWTLAITINSAINLNTRPFLMEVFLKSGESIKSYLTSIASPPDPPPDPPLPEPKYIRCLLRNEPVEVPNETEETAVDGQKWVMYRTGTISRKFSSYSDLEAALNSTLAVLNSNVESFNTLTPVAPPRLIAINLSTEKKEPQLESIEAYKGDVIVLQLVGGSSSVTAVSDKLFGPMLKLTGQKVSSNSVAMKLQDDGHTSIGLIDGDTAITYSIAVTMLPTSELIITETI